jgi:hypothetical protein
MEPNVRIKENARYSILHKLLSKPWIVKNKIEYKLKEVNINQLVIYKQL